jgi:hypothetical protein
LRDYFFRRRGKAWSFEFFRSYGLLNAARVACSRTREPKGAYLLNGILEPYHDTSEKITSQESMKEGKRS